MQSILMEQKCKLDILEKINDRMEKSFEQHSYGKRICFVSRKGIPFNVYAFPGRYALVIEYAESEEDATDGRFEDGDLFYLEDYTDENALYNAMVSEIEDV